MKPTRIRIGIAGFGSAGRSFLPALAAHSGFLLTGVAEPSVELRADIFSTAAVPVYPHLEAMLDADQIDAVYIATPTVLHEQHMLQVVAAGKHVIVEKPMAVHVQSALSMALAVERAGVVCVVGHSHGFDGPIQAMRDLIDKGSLGSVRMVSTTCYTDWMYRPRREEELDHRQGGGVTYRQGSHQFDILRVLCGGLARSVRAQTFGWDSARPGIGAHTTFIPFASGAVATASYNGYGNFDSSEICFDIGEQGFQVADAPSLRAQFEAGGADGDVQAAKQRRARQLHAAKDAPPFQPFFGLTLVSCENGDIRQSPRGLFVYTKGSRYEIELAADSGPRTLVLDELQEAIRSGQPPLHSARWGLANLELCDAAIESSRVGAEVFLQHQIGLHPNADGLLAPVDHGGTA
jgi:phthalate 4,5-cis-dihydrodiol dehydrogenase